MGAVVQRPPLPLVEPACPGLREFVVGTGGIGHHPILYDDVYATSQKRDFFNFGLLRLRLAPTAYSWAFVKEDGAAVDSGSATCR